MGAQPRGGYGRRAARRSAITSFTAGELLRIDQLRPDPDRSSQTRLDLFETAVDRNNKHHNH